jgi:tripartite-type tricarboxylate transporter receptor subunit TctC
MSLEFTRRIALGALASAAILPARAQSNAIRIVVPFGPGGSTDAVARLVSPGLMQRLGVPIIVENRPGAAGSIGTDAVAKARPDGQTWLLTFDSHATMPALLPSLPFNLTRDLDPVMLIGGAPYVIACRADKPFRSLTDVVNAAKAKPDGVSFGSTGNGTIGHLAMIQLQSRSGTRMTHIPYRSGGLAVNDTMAGTVDMMIGSAALVASQIAAGTFRALSQFGPARLPALSDLPTAEESGFPGLQAEAWWGVFAPAGTPAELVTRMNNALRETLSEERIRTQMTQTQQARLAMSDPAGLARFLDGEVTKWSAVVREFSVRPD